MLLKDFLDVLSERIDVLLIYGRWFSYFECKDKIPKHLLNKKIESKGVTVAGGLEIRIMD